MDKRATKKRIISIALTLTVISLLILSGPVNAVQVVINQISDSTPNEASTVNFLVQVDIESGERIPVQNLTLTLTNAAGLSNYTCTFGVSGTAITTCTGISISAVNTDINYSNGTSVGFGYGYVYSTGVTNNSNTTFDTAFGYGYQAGYASSASPWSELAYNITWTTPSVTSNTAYSADFAALVEDGSGVKRTYITSTSSTITVQNVAANATDDDDDDSSSSSSGGGGVPPSLGQIAKYSRQWNKVTVGSETSATITNALIAVTRVAFTTKATFDNVGIDIASINKPGSLPKPKGTVFQYLDIDASNMPDSGVVEGKIRFKISKLWFNTNNLKRNNVRLMRYKNGWQTLTTKEISTTTNDVIFEAITPGFSYFAITALPSTTTTSTTTDETTTTTTEETPTETIDETTEETTTEPDDAKETSLAWLFWLILIIVLVVLGAYYYVSKKNESPIKKK